MRKMCTVMMTILALAAMVLPAAAQAGGGYELSPQLGQSQGMQSGTQPGAGADRLGAIAQHPMTQVYGIVQRGEGNLFSLSGDDGRVYTLDLSERIYTVDRETGQLVPTGQVTLAQIEPLVGQRVAVAGLLTRSYSPTGSEYLGGSPREQFETGNILKIFEIRPLR